jgi:hypothetical protein
MASGKFCLHPRTIDRIFAFLQSDTAFSYVFCCKKHEEISSNLIRFFIEPCANERYLLDRFCIVAVYDCFG